jgi:hypothetical protein
MHEIYSSLDQRKATALTTIDLSAAFDCVNHDIFLTKISKIGLPVFFFNLIQSFLSGRIQVVKIGSILSDVLSVYCGAPQGGVLAALFFIIYLNRILNLNLNGRLIGYVDDLTLVSSENTRENLEKAIQSDLNQIFQNLLLHKLRPNPTKSNYLIFEGRRNFEQFTERAMNLKLGTISIERAESVKILGLHIDEQLKFSNQIASIKNKILPFISKFFRIRHFLNNKVAESMYFSFVHWAFNFMNTIWSNAPNYLLESLAVIQRRALRTVYKKERLCHNVELYSEKILPLQQICKLQLIITLFKMKSRLMKNNHHLVLVRDSHHYSTRRISKFARPIALRSYGHQNFYYRAILLYNELPDEITKYNSLAIFKQRTKEHLYQTYLNSLNA